MGLLNPRKLMLALVSNPSRFQYFHVSYLGTVPEQHCEFLGRDQRTMSTTNSHPQQFSAQFSRRNSLRCWATWKAGFMVTLPSKTAWQLPRRKDTWLSMVMEKHCTIWNDPIEFGYCQSQQYSRMAISCVSYFMLMSLAFASELFIFMPCTSIQFCLTTNLTYRKTNREKPSTEAAFIYKWTGSYLVHLSTTTV